MWGSGQSAKPLQGQVASVMGIEVPIGATTAVGAALAPSGADQSWDRNRYQNEQDIVGFYAHCPHLAPASVPCMATVTLFCHLQGL